MDDAGVTLTKDVPVRKYVDLGMSSSPTLPTAAEHAIMYLFLLPSTCSQHQIPAIRFGFARLSPPPVPVTSLSSCRPGFP